MKQGLRLVSYAAEMWFYQADRRGHEFFDLLGIASAFVERWQGGRSLNFRHSFYKRGLVRRVIGDLDPQGFAGNQENRIGRIITVPEYLQVEFACRRQAG